MSLRIYQGRFIGHRHVNVRHWIGGRGYVEVPMIEVWNPAHPEHRTVVTPEVFYTLTAPVTRLAA